MLLDVDLKNTNQLAAEGAATLIGISVLTDSNSGPAMKVAAGALGFVAGNAGYNFLFGPGSVVDGVEHPWDSAKSVITDPKHATIGQDLATAGLAYGGMQAGKLAYKGGKNLYGRVVQGGSNAAEESEVGVEAVEGAVEGAEVAGGAVEGVASAGFFSSIGSWFSGAAAEVGTVVAEEPILAAVALAPIGL